MSVARRRRQWHDECREAQDLLERVQALGTRLLEPTVVDEFDGFPASASGAGSGRGGTGDPLGDRIAGLVDNDLGRERVVREMWDGLRAAVEWLRLIEAAGTRAAPRPRIERLPAKPEAAACVNCDRFEIYAIAVRAGRCWACYRYRLDHDGTDAPRSLVLARLENATRRQLAHRQESA